MAIKQPQPLVGRAVELAEFSPEGFGRRVLACRWREGARGPGRLKPFHPYRCYLAALGLLASTSGYGRLAVRVRAERPPSGGAPLRPRN